MLAGPNLEVDSVPRIGHTLSHFITLFSTFSRLGPAYRRLYASGWNLDHTFTISRYISITLSVYSIDTITTVLTVYTLKYSIGPGHHMRMNILVKYPTHAVNIQSNSDQDRISCFKYNRGRCELELYTWADLDRLSDYIREPLPVLVYAVHIDEDSE
jgi:hypothetical protein